MSTMIVKMETTFENEDEEIDVVTVDESGKHTDTYSNTETMRPLLVKAKEVDVISVDPNADKIIKFDLLTRELSADYVKESCTNTDSDTEDAKTFSCKAEEIDVVGVDLNYNDTLANTVLNAPKSLSGTNEIVCEAASKISLKRKRQNLDCDHGASKTILTRYKANAKINESNNILNDSKSKSSKKATASQKKKASSSPARISPVKSSNCKQYSAASRYSTYCPRCKETVNKRENNYKSQCHKCNTPILYQCKKCGHRRRTYLNLFKHLRYSCYSTEIPSCKYSTQKKNKLDDGHHMDIHFSASEKMQRVENAMKPPSASASTVEVLNSSTEAQNDMRFRTSAYTTYFCLGCKKSVNVTGSHGNRQCRECKMPVLYQCKKCNLQHRYYWSFLRHLHHACYPREILTCNHCNYATHRKDHLSNHIMNQHTKSPKLEGVLKCNECIFKTKFRPILNHHMDNHLLEKVFAESEASRKSTKTNGKEEPSVKIGYCFKCQLMKPLQTGQCPKCQIKMMLVCNLCCTPFRDHAVLNRHRNRWHKNQPQYH